MIWQDYVISGVGWAFALALAPTLRPSATKPPALTSFCNAALLLILGLTVATLDAIFGAVAMILTAILWATIGIQGMRR
jgi:hypothetical protein